MKRISLAGVAAFGLLMIACLLLPSAQATVTYPNTYPAGGEATITVTASTVQATTDEFDVNKGDDYLSIDVDNQASGAVSSLIIQLKDHSAGNWYSYFGDTDFSSTTDSRLKFATTTTPNATPAAQQTHAKVNIGKVFAVRFLVTLGSGSGSVVIKCSNYK